MGSQEFDLADLGLDQIPDLLGSDGSDALLNFLKSGLSELEQAQGGVDHEVRQMLDELRLQTNILKEQRAGLKSSTSVDVAEQIERSVVGVVTCVPFVSSRQTLPLSCST
jgi:hypothetical protein